MSGNKESALEEDLKLADVTDGVTNQNGLTSAKKNGDVSASSDADLDKSTDDSEDAADENGGTDDDNEKSLADDSSLADTSMESTDVDTGDLEGEGCPIEAENTVPNTVPSLIIKQETVENESKVDSGPLVPNEEFGKGRRARVPNKRYSDILPRVLSGSPPHKVRRITVNGETVYDTVPAEVSYDLPLNRKKKNIDMRDPKFLKPLDCGWKRELVFRAQSEYGVKRAGDIYYYSPLGRKVRSMRELAECLTDKRLSLDDFTFYKESLGVDDPDKEIIRDAKLRSTVFDTGHKKKKKKTPVSTPVTTTTTTSIAPGSKSKNAMKTIGFKIKLPNKLKSKAIVKREESPKSKSKTTSKSISTTAGTVMTAVEGGIAGGGTGTVPAPKCPPCSMRCAPAPGLIPTLQCRICLCLYHNQCMGVAIGSAAAAAYICKNCQPSDDQLAAPTVSATSAATNTPTLSNKSEQADEIKTDINIAATPSFSEPKKTPQSTTPLPNSTTTTTSTSQQVIPPISAGPPQRPQFVEYIGRRKFIIVPRPYQESARAISSERNGKAAEIPAVATPAEYAGTKEAKTPSRDSAKLKRTASKAYRDDAPKKLKMQDTVEVSPVDTHKENMMDTNEVANIIEPKLEVDEAAIADKNTEPSAIAHISKNANVIPKSEVSDKERKQTLDSSDDGFDDDLDDDDDEFGDSDETGDSFVDAKRKVAVSKKSPKSSSIAPPELIPKTEVSDTFGELVFLSSERNEEDVKQFVSSYMQNLSFGYTTLLQIFQYLKVQDLLNASCVCTMWRDLASHTRLWRTVRMKNSQIHSFAGLAAALARHRTQHLDLRKMLLPVQADSTAQWDDFSSSIAQVDSLRRVEFCRCPVAVVERIAASNPGLEAINATTIKCDNINLDAFSNLRNLRELRLKSLSSLTLKSSLSALESLKFLRNLSLTSIKDMDKLNIEVIGKLSDLESLEIGECMNLLQSFGTDILVKLQRLEKLRLEKGQGSCQIFDILATVKHLPKLEQLELVNFDIKAGFDKCLGACSNIKRLLIIPTYVSQSATTNHMVLGGVLRLQETLQHFVWGVTLELLRVTELFVDQCDESNRKDRKEKKQTGDSIPILKPIPKAGETSDVALHNDPPQVEILPLPNLQKILLANLPTTRVKILKIPFHATWRQSITDSAIN